jgi:hypothetical protein
VDVASIFDRTVCFAAGGMAKPMPRAGIRVEFEAKMLIDKSILRESRYFRTKTSYY